MRDLVQLEICTCIIKTHLQYTIIIKRDVQNGCACMFSHILDVNSVITQRLIGEQNFIHMTQFLLPMLWHQTLAAGLGLSSSSL